MDKIYIYGLFELDENAYQEAIEEYNKNKVSYE